MEGRRDRTASLAAPSDVQTGQAQRKGPALGGAWTAWQRSAYSTGVMSEACAPFGPWVTSYCTRWPSWRLRKPFELIAEKCANTSAPPSSGVMKPNPLAPLNHFTVPYCIPLMTSLSGFRALYPSGDRRPRSLQTEPSLDN